MIFADCTYGTIFIVVISAGFTYGTILIVVISADFTYGTIVTVVISADFIYGTIFITETKLATEPENFLSVVRKLLEHLLQHCRLHDTLKRNKWPEPTLLRDKLYGNLEELRRTAAFVRATGISI